jgi:hypothetical protein
MRPGYTVRSVGAIFAVVVMASVATTFALVACNGMHPTGEGCHGAGGGADDCGAPVDETACPTTIVDCDGPEGAFAVGPVDCPTYAMSCPGDGGRSCAAGLVLTLSSAIAQYPGCPVYCCAGPDAEGDDS